MEKFYSYDLKCEVQQIQKRTARNLFNAGCTIYLLPANMRFDNFWQKPMPTDNTCIGYRETFDNVCATYAFYQCDCERGYYPRFYVKVTDLQN